MGQASGTLCSQAGMTAIVVQWHAGLPAQQPGGVAAQSMRPAQQAPAPARRRP